MNLQPPSESPARPGDKPSFLIALLSFLFPVVGLVLWLVDRDGLPLRARSAARGALLGLVPPVVLGVLMVASFIVPARQRAARHVGLQKCSSNMRQVGLALMQYRMDHDDRFPDLSSATTMQAALQPYLGTPDIFNCPTDKAAYRPNRALSFKKNSQLSTANDTVMLYETDRVHMDGCNVNFVSGNTRWHLDRMWQVKKRADRLP